MLGWVLMLFTPALGPRPFPLLLQWNTTMRPTSTATFQAPNTLHLQQLMDSACAGKARHGIHHRSRALQYNITRWV